MTKTDLLDSIVGLAMFFSPVITPFVLVTFTPMRQLRQPRKLFAVAIVCAAVAAILGGLAMTRGTISERRLYFIAGISAVVGAFVSFAFSSGTITEKTKDEIVRKSDDQSWRGP